MGMGPAKGTQLLGLELKRCYEGDSSLDGKRHGHGVYRHANGFFTYTGTYVLGEKHGGLTGRPSLAVAVWRPGPAEPS
jgi:hypothetical protein